METPIKHRMIWGGKNPLFLLQHPYAHVCNGERNGYQNYDPPLAFAGATSLTYWATATPLRPSPKPLIKPRLMFGDVWIKCQMVIVENPIKMGWFGGTPIFGNTQMMKHTENTLQSAAYCLLFGNNSWAYCFGFFSFSAKVAYCPFPFAKSRPRMRSERVGAKPVSRLPNVSSSPATISASQKACKALISQIWNMPCLSNCTALAAKTPHVGLACSSHSSSQQCYWPKQKPQPQSTGDTLILTSCSTAWGPNPSLQQGSKTTLVP